MISHAVSKPHQNLPASFWLRRRQRRAASVLALGAVFAGSLHSASADTTYRYTGPPSLGSASAPVTGNFSTGFNPQISIDQMTCETTTNDTLSFAGTTYNAIDDFTNTIKINALSFSNTGTVTIVRGSGNTTLSSVTLGRTLGGTAPTITTGTGSVAINLDLSLAANAMFNIGSGGLAVNGVISGSGYGFTESGSSVLILSAANMYGGGTTINSASTLQVGDGRADTSGTLGTGVVVDNGALVFSRSVAAATSNSNGAAATTSNIISGTGSLLQNGLGTLTLSGANTYSGGTTINSGTVINLNTAKAALGTGAVVDNGSLNLSATQLSVLNNISGAGSINLTGTGNLVTLSGDNTAFTGTITTNTNTLKLGSAAALGKSSGVTIGPATSVAGGTLDFNGYSPLLNVPLSLATGTSGASGTLTNSNSTAVSFGGAITVSGFGSLNVTGAGDINLSGAITSPTTTNIAMSGTNTLTLSGTSDNTPGLVASTGTVILGKTSHHAVGINGLSITGGTVQLSGSGGDQIADGASVNLAGGTFDLHGNSETIGNLTSTGGSITNMSAGTTSILTASEANGGSSSSSVISNGSGTVGITKSGVSTLTFTGANTYTGTTTISGGTLQLGSGGSVGSLAAGGTIVDNGNFTLNRSNAVAQGTDFSSSAISGTGTLTQVGSGTTTLNIANTYTGGTIVTGGTLSASAANSLGTGALAVNNANTGAGTNVIVNFNTNANQTVNGLSSTVAKPSSGTNTAQVNIAAGSTLTDNQSGSTNYAGSVSGSGTLNIGGQSSASTATVNYTGTDTAAQTNVNAYATVQLANTTGAALSGPVAVATNGTLTINANATNNEIATTAPPSTTPTTAAVTLNGGTLNANGSDGAVNTPTQLATTTIKSSMGALTLGTGGTKTTPSLLALAGGTTGSPIILAFADSSQTLGSGYLNITGYTGTTNALYIGTASTLTLTQLQQISFNGLAAQQLSNGEIVAAPEPSTLLSLLIGTAALGGLAWSRRRSAQQTAVQEA